MEELNTVGGIQTNPYGRTEVSVIMSILYFIVYIQCRMGCAAVDDIVV